MPWQETGPMEQRRQFIEDWLTRMWSVHELSARYGIAPKTAYKWLSRFRAEGARGLEDRSRRPKNCPHQSSDRVRALLVEAKHAHPSWGPKKLLPWLKKRHPRLEFPAASTVGDYLASQGLVQKRRSRRRHKHPGAHKIRTTGPNDLWTADFKGQFRMRNGEWCYPLTIADQHTRYLLACDGKTSVKQAGTIPVFRRLFRKYGLPLAIRTDNGSPFCSSTGIHGLTNLNTWWMRLGIEHSRMDPGSPQQNGAHERMHRTLKAEAARPAQANMQAQQRRFNAWRAEYNDERPHEFLDDDTPADHYQSSPRPFPERIPEPEYPGHFLTPLVSNAGTYRFKTRLLFISSCLRGSRIGLEETGDGVWDVYFYDVLLARLDERTRELFT